MDSEVSPSHTLLFPCPRLEFVYKLPSIEFIRLLPQLLPQNHSPIFSCPSRSRSSARRIQHLLGESGVSFFCCFISKEDSRVIETHFRKILTAWTEQSALGFSLFFLAIREQAKAYSLRFIVSQCECTLSEQIPNGNSNCTWSSLDNQGLPPPPSGGEVEGVTEPETSGKAWPPCSQSALLREWGVA